MGYYNVVPTSSMQTTTIVPTTSSSQTLDIKPSAVILQQPSYSPLVNIDHKSSPSISSDKIVHTSMVFIDDFEADCDQAYLNMAIIPRRISPEPVVARSGDVVRNVVGWAWTCASKGAISTYNDAFRVRRQARHMLL